MDKLKTRIYKEVLEGVSAHFDGADKFIEEIMGEIRAPEKLA